MRLLNPRAMIIACLFAVTTLGSLSLSQADDLFSSGGLESVFGGPATTPTTPDTAPDIPVQPGTPDLPQQVVPQTPIQSPLNPAQQRITKQQMEGLLQAAGLTTKKINDNLITSEFKSGQWTFPVAFTVSPNGEKFWIIMILNTLEDETQLSRENLLGLLKANYEHGPAHFTYSEKVKRIDITRAISTLGLDVQGLKNHLQLLADIADKTSSLWANLPKPGTPAQQPAPIQQTPVRPSDPSTSAPGTAPNNSLPYWVTPSQTQQPARSINGNWSSAQSQTELFRLKFNADGTFTLVHKKDQITNQSTGIYTVNKNTLTMITSDGTTLVGSITWQNNQSFLYKLNTAEPNATGLLFARV